jgi:hypothetical protein
VFAGALLENTIGHGSQGAEQQAERTRPADRAVQARKPIRAARPATFLRIGI